MPAGSYYYEYFPISCWEESLLITHRDCLQARSDVLLARCLAFWCTFEITLASQRRLLMMHILRESPLGHKWIEPVGLL